MEILLSAAKKSAAFPSWAEELLRRVFSYRLVRFLCVGGAGAVIHTGTLYLFTDILGLWYLIGTSVGFLVGTSFGFFAQKFWTFRDAHMRHVYLQVPIFFGTAFTTNLVLNNMLMYTAVDVLGLWHIGSQIAVSGSVALINFMFYRRIFAGHHR